VHSPSLSPLLPEVVKLEKQDAAVEPAAVRILGGSLASNNKGGLLWTLCLHCVSWLQIGYTAEPRTILLCVLCALLAVDISAGAPVFLRILPSDKPPLGTMVCAHNFQGRPQACVLCCCCL